MDKIPISLMSAIVYKLNRYDSTDKYVSVIFTYVKYIL